VEAELDVDVERGKNVNLMNNKRTTKKENRERFLRRSVMGIVVIVRGKGRTQKGS